MSNIDHKKLISIIFILFLAINVFFSFISYTDNSYNDVILFNENEINYSKDLNIASKGNDVSVNLYLILKNGSILMVPLKKVIGQNCSSINPDAEIGVYSIYTGGSVNFTLPNGTRINTLNIILNAFLGCSWGEPRIHNITIRQQIPGTLDLIVNVLVPPPSNVESYRLPAILYASRAEISYNYVNDTYYTINIKLFNIKFNDITFYNYKKFNITIKFLVNKRTWNAEYWNGDKWVYAGVIPIGAPDLNVTSMLYKIYMGYLNASNYYLSHKDQLINTINKIKTLLANNETEEAQKLLDNITYSPLPAEWRGHRFIYLDYNYTLDPVAASAADGILRFTVPEYNWVLATMSPRAITGKKDIVNAAVDYLTEGNISLLKHIILSNNSFIVYNSVYHSSGNGSLLYIYKDGVLPLTSPSLLLALPVDSLIGLPPELANRTAVAVLEISSNITNLTVGSNASDLSTPEVGSEGVTVTVDGRLADEWMVTLNSTVSNLRTGVLQNLYNVILNSYRKTWYDMINAKNVSESMEDLEWFRVYLRSAVLAAAFQLGGASGKAKMEGLLPTVAPPGGHSENMTGSHNPLNGRGLLLVAGAALAVVAAAAVILYRGRMRRR